ncbi:alpha/beta fold hydrolase [Fodinicola feengrottensis]|uniref:alpha/beta fold hydrolase n=1 Tax=Fodinicola feengrottensis TaxID=435914 RepID=UPI002440F97D|nr:hypothetical protein [Fodinicola feengrottensis]
MGCSDGAIVGLLTALRRPDLVARLVFAAGVFHRDGWHDGVLDGAADDDFSLKLQQMHADGPTVTVQELAGLPNRTLVLLGDDDEVRLEHAVTMYEALPPVNSRCSPAPPMACWWKSRRFATRSSWISLPTTRCPRWRPFGGADQRGAASASATVRLSSYT